MRRYAVDLVRRRVTSEREMVQVRRCAQHASCCWMRLHSRELWPSGEMICTQWLVSHAFSRMHVFLERIYSQWKASSGLVVSVCFSLSCMSWWQELTQVTWPVYVPPSCIHLRNDTRICAVRYRTLNSSLHFASSDTMSPHLSVRHQVASCIRVYPPKLMSKSSWVTSNSQQCWRLHFC